MDDDYDRLKGTVNRVGHIFLALYDDPENTRIYLEVATITDEAMHQLEAHFGVKAREGYLD